MGRKYDDEMFAFCLPFVGVRRDTIIRLLTLVSTTIMFKTT